MATIARRARQRTQDNKASTAQLPTADGDDQASTSSQPAEPEEEEEEDDEAAAERAEDMSKQRALKEGFRQQADDAARGILGQDLPPEFKPESDIGRPEDEEAPAQVFEIPIEAINASEEQRIATNGRTFESEYSPSTSNLPPPHTRPSSEQNSNSAETTQQEQMRQQQSRMRQQEMLMKEQEDMRRREAEAQQKKQEEERLAAQKRAREAMDGDSCCVIL